MKEPANDGTTLEPTADPAWVLQADGYDALRETRSSHASRSATAYWASEAREL